LVHSAKRWVYKKDHPRSRNENPGYRGCCPFKISYTHSFRRGSRERKLQTYERRIHMLTRTFLKHAFLAAAVCAMLCALAPALPAAQKSTAPDLKPYQTMAQEALKLVAAKDMKGASKKMDELESKWDASGLNQTLPNVDSEMDAAKDAVGSGDPKKATAELNTYLGLLDRVSKQPAKK
jgi:hypothetical protein